MQKADLTLESYFVERLSWSLAEGFDPQSADKLPLVLECESIQTHVERAELENVRHAVYRLTLRFDAQPQHSPYEWQIALIGYFRASDARSDADVEALMDSNAPALLYGAAREALAGALGRGPYSAPLLPTVHFADLAGAAAAPDAQTKPKRKRKKSDEEGGK